MTLIAFPNVDTGH